MKVSECQQEFTRLQALLVTWCFDQGYKLTDGDAYRAPSVHGEFGVKKSYSSAYSLHKMRLARDYNLFLEGSYIADGSHPVWKEIGKKWESMHEKAKWGGHWGDANHFSFSYAEYR